MFVNVGADGKNIRACERYALQVAGSGNRKRRLFAPDSVHECEGRPLRPIQYLATHHVALIGLGAVLAFNSVMEPEPLDAPKAMSGFWRATLPVVIWI